MSYGQYSTNPAEHTNPLRHEPAIAGNKRVKQVFQDESEIAHLWAHKAQSSARNRQGNFYFSGDTIYSYGAHFPIARIVAVAKGRNKGQELVYETTRGYSNTTAGHKRAIYSAIRQWDAEANARMVLYKDRHGVEHSYESKGAWLEAGRRIFSVTDPTADTNQLINDWSNRITEAGTEILDAPKGTRKATKARKFVEVAELVAAANDWAEYVGERYRWNMPASLESLTEAMATERRKQDAKKRRENARLERIAAARQKQYEADNAGKVAAWIAGDNVQFPWGIRECYLRIEGEELVTSQGARVPIDHALKALPLVRAVVARGERWERNGHQIRLGHYQIDSIEADGTVKAGCHVVPFSEIERIAPELS